MLQPSEFLDTAKLLVSARGGSPTDADLRRCVSTAYYAVFHAVLTAGADRFFGRDERDKAGYGFLYRGYDHGRTKRICEQVARASLDASRRERRGRLSFHADLKSFAQYFVRLHSARERADYDPRIEVTIAEAQSAIEDAERAIASLHRAPADERADLLASLLINRG